MKFYIEFEQCKECKSIIYEIYTISDEIRKQEASKKFLRHIMYNHREVIHGIVEGFPKEAERENFPWFR